jgi:hypothetical protein
VTPYLAVTAPERRSGKSRVLEALRPLVARPFTAVTPSEAVLFRKIAKDSPTLLLDETDAIFRDRSNTYEGIRALLNAGNRRGTSVPRCVGPAFTIQEFDVFCAKALAGIGELPDTVADRSIPIRLKRRAPTESVEPFFPEDEEASATRIRDVLAGWAAENVDELRTARPRPEGIHDRAAEAWQPLLAIADRVGGTWPKRARDAALALHATQETEDQSRGVQLLADIREVFGEEDRLKSSDLATTVCRIETSPWGDYRGKPLDPRALARLLQPYPIKPHKIRFPDGTFQGYERADFTDAWSRYPPVPHSDRNIGTPQVEG